MGNSAKSRRAYRNKQGVCRCDRAYLFPHRRGSKWCQHYAHPERLDPDELQAALEASARHLCERMKADQRMAENRGESDIGSGQLRSLAGRWR